MKKNYFFTLMFSAFTIALIIFGCREENMSSTTSTASAGNRTENFFKKSTDVTFKNGLTVNDYLTRLENINNKNNFVEKLTDKIQPKNWDFFQLKIAQL